MKEGQSNILTYDLMSLTELGRLLVPGDGRTGDGMHTAGQEAARAGCEYDYFGFKTLERSCLLRRTGRSSSAHSTR